MKAAYFLVVSGLTVLISCEAKEDSVAAGSGEELYSKHCETCHQKNGERSFNLTPPLAKSDFLLNREATIKQVLKGSSGKIIVNGVEYQGVMLPQHLTDEECAKVLTYVYCNFGNIPDTVTSEEVRTVREKLK